MDASLSGDIATGGSTLLSAFSDVQDASNMSRLYSLKAKATKKGAALQSAQYRQAANNSRADSQQEAAQSDREGRIAISNAVARAAGSGGGASDPGVTSIIGRLASDSKYNALSALYTGESQARGYEDAAKIGEYNAANEAAGDKFAGGLYKRNGWMQAGGDILSGGSTFLKKYGEPTKPTKVTPTDGGVYDNADYWGAYR